MIRKAQKVEGEVGGLMTVADAAKYLGVSHIRVNQFIQTNRIKATKMSERLYLVDAEDLRRFASLPRKIGRPKQK